MKTHVFLSITAAFLAVVGHAHAAANSETARNLRTAFVGESNAAHRYEIFAQKADADGFRQAAKLFRAAARSESIHRERHRAALQKLGGDASDARLDPITAASTAENLRAAIAGESHERDTMYPQFIASAKSEDARGAVRTLQAALSAEKEHARLFQQVLDQVGQGTRDTDVTYFVCRDCGYTVTARPADKCPVCREPASKFASIL